MNKILRAALLIAMLLGAAKGYCQQSSQNKNTNTGTFSIAVSPFTIFEYEPSINLHLMYKFNNGDAVAIEVGRIIKPFSNNDENFISTRAYTGWRFRPEFRLRRKVFNWRKTYLAFQGLIKTAKEQSYYEVQRTTPSGFYYTEAMEQETSKTVLGFNCLVGKQSDLLKSEKIFIDQFMGFGLRHKYYRDNIGTDFNKPRDWDFNNKNGIYPTVVLGIRVGLKVK